MSRTANKARVPYRPRQDAIAALEAARRAAGVTLQELADRAGIAVATLRRMRRDGRAFRRQVAALRLALRSIEADRRAEGELFKGDEDADAGTGGAGRA